MEETQTTSTPSKMSMLIPAGVLVALVLGVGVVLATRQPGTPASQDGMSMESSMPQNSAQSSLPSEANAGDSEMMKDESEVRVINVEGGSFYYKPNELRVKKGETVKIVFDSKDMMHDLVIDELGVRVPVTKGGEKSEVTFTADTAGSFEFYCSVGQHRAQGQVGTLIVE